MRILLVDDDFFFQKTLSFYLEDMNHQVLFAQDGQKALEVLAFDKTIDLVICDLDMPVLSGESFLSALKELYPLKRPVIAVASGMMHGEEFLKKTGIAYDHYFRKPLDVNNFGKTIDDIGKIRGA